MEHCNTAVDELVETLCEQGCSAVLGYLEALRAGQSLVEFSDLDNAERELLRDELQAIMAIYNDRCRL